jgi:hypothetical protein
VIRAARALWFAGVIACAACSRDAATPKSAPDPAPAARDLGGGKAPATGDDDAHDVVFSDRASAAYLLLVRESEAAAPTRPELVALARTQLGDGPEIVRLVELIEQPPIRPVVGATDVGATALGPTASEQERVRRLDLLGLAIEVHPLRSDESVIPAEHLTHPVLTRLLTPEERQGLGERTHAIMLRADYRNRDAVRGLRLLQTVVRLLAEQRHALIYDADTNETVGPEVFTQRRLRAGVGNIAEQIVIVPFPDPRHGPEYARLTTRGMRRFGCPELELDGLAVDPQVLDRATDLLAGLAYRVIRDSEYDPSGYAVEANDVIEVGIDEVKQAYAGTSVRTRTCADCMERTRVHLVERASEPHDPAEQLVVRVVAPRETSDARDYDQSKWAITALQELFGPMR